MRMGFAVVLMLLLNSADALARGARFAGNQQTGLKIPPKKALPPPQVRAQPNHNGLTKFNPNKPNQRIRPGL